MTGNWLRDRREFIGLTQDDLAAKLQLAGFRVSRSLVSHWENGRNPPPFDDSEFTKELARILKMSVATMLRQAGYEVATDYSDDARQAAEIVDQLPEKQRKLAIKLLEQVLQEYAAAES